jgi:hypothetical protein
MKRKADTQLNGQDGKSILKKRAKTGMHLIALKHLTPHSLTK